MRTIRCERPVRAGYIADYNAGVAAGIRGIQTNIDSKLLKMTTLVARHRIELSSKHLLRNVSSASRVRLRNGKVRTGTSGAWSIRVWKRSVRSLQHLFFF